jgi:hypothetical protein
MGSVGVGGGPSSSSQRHKGSRPLRGGRVRAAMSPAWCASGVRVRRPVRLAYQPPASSTFLSEQTSHQQSSSSTFLSEQISNNHQPPAKRTACGLLTCCGAASGSAGYGPLFFRLQAGAAAPSPSRLLRCGPADWLET